MRAQRLILVVAIALGVGYGWLRGAFVGTASSAEAPQKTSAAAGLETATFAAGCFWCAEADFEKVTTRPIKARAVAPAE